MWGLTKRLRTPRATEPDRATSEQTRILALLVESVDVSLDGLAIKLRTEGLEKLVEELGGLYQETGSAA